MDLSKTLKITLLVLILCPSFTLPHNITKILSNHPEFSTFNHYLTTTHLASDINSRTTITVCVVDNPSMNKLLSKNLSLPALKNVLAFHVLLDYFGAKKLHQITDGTALAATMFQATGTATGSSGFVNITDLKGGKVGFGAKDRGKSDAFYVKSVKEIPYNISVIQITTILPSPEAEAPTPGPSAVNLTSLMSTRGCKVFAETLLASPAEKTYEGNLDGGLTVFCPIDDAFKAFLPKYKNLSAEGQQSLLEYHGMPVYESLSMLKSSNGLMNTLATDGKKKYDITVQNDGETVTLKTKVVIAKILGTSKDEDPLVIYTIDKVLLPTELFKAGLAPAPAPEPAADAPAAEAPVADAPKASKKKKKHLAPPETDSPSDSPADSPDGNSDDQVADANGVVKFDGSRFVAVALCLCLVLLQI